MPASGAGFPGLTAAEAAAAPKELRPTRASKFWRDSKVGQIYEGTSNMQLATIAKTILTDRL